ncbi:MAG TPA: hypothetical protein VG712_01680, partial [Gemmatimonadales bacterium]|nr:hypothetical protein [Gemmatimonadales bacterium]
MSRFGGLVLLVAFAVSPLAAQQGWPGRTGLEVERCSLASGDGSELLSRAIVTAGIGAVQGAVQFNGTETHTQAFQSDRMYPPFITAT